MTGLVWAKSICSTISPERFVLSHVPMHSLIIFFDWLLTLRFTWLTVNSRSHKPLRVCSSRVQVLCGFGCDPMTYFPPEYPGTSSVQRWLCVPVNVWSGVGLCMVFVVMKWIDVGGCITLHSLHNVAFVCPEELLKNFRWWQVLVLLWKLDRKCDLTSMTERKIKVMLF